MILLLLPLTINAACRRFTRLIHEIHWEGEALYLRHLWRAQIPKRPRLTVFEEGSTVEWNLEIQEQWRKKGLQPTTFKPFSPPLSKPLEDDPYTYGISSILGLLGPTITLRKMIGRLKTDLFLLPIAIIQELPQSEVKRFVLQFYLSRDDVQNHHFDHWEAQMGVRGWSAFGHVEGVRELRF